MGTNDDDDDEFQFFAAAKWELKILHSFPLELSSVPLSYVRYVNEIMRVNLGGWQNNIFSASFPELENFRLCQILRCFPASTCRDDIVAFMKSFNEKKTFELGINGIVVNMWKLYEWYECASHHPHIVAVSTANDHFHFTVCRTLWADPWWWWWKIMKITENFNWPQKLYTQLECVIYCWGLSVVCELNVLLTAVALGRPLSFPFNYSYIAMMLWRKWRNLMST